jgi:TP901 family phage tail tape measure protein
MANVGEIKAKLSLNSSEFKAGMAQARSEMNATSKAAQNTKKSLTGIQTGAAIVATGVVAALGGATMAAANFEKQLSAIEAVSGASQSEMDTLSKLIMDLGESSVYSASQVGVAAEEMIKAGISLEDIIGGGLAGALDLASAGSLALGDAAEIASTALNAFKADGLEVSDAANLLAGAANASATSVGELKFGLSMVSAVASGAGMSFKDTTTALAVFAQNGLKGSDAGTSLKTMLMNLSPSTKAASEQMKELGIITKDGSNQFYDAQGNLKSLSDITDVLRDSLDELNPKERGEALREMFGADAIRAGTILFKEGADGIEAMAAAMDKVKAADVAKVKLDNLIGSFEEFKGALETAGIKIGNEFLPVFKEIVQEGTEVIRMFSSLDPSVVATGLKMAGAGAGVALLLSTIGKLSIALRTLSMGPFGLAIIGVSLLTAGLVGLSDRMHKYADVNTEAVDAMAKQHASNTEMIDQFEKLQGKLLLSNDEFERLVDLNARIKSETDPTKLKDLQTQFDHLQKKSGLTNDELEDMLGLNKNLTEKIPEATKKITDQGNRIADTAGKMREYNKEFAKDILRGYEKELNTAMANQEERLKRIKGLQSDHKAGLDEESELRDLINGKTEKQLSNHAKKLQSQIDNNELIGEERAKAEELIMMIETRGKDALRSKLSTLMGHNDELQKSIEKEQKQISKVDEIKKKMIDVVLQEVKLNGKKGDGIRLIDTEIAKLIEQKRKIAEGTTAKEKTTAEYRNAVATIDKEIAKLHGARDAVAEITGAQRGVNSKVAEGIALAQRLNDVLSKRIDKTVNITEIKRLITQSERAARSLGVDTSRHQGGPLPKFHSGGSPALMGPPSHHEMDVRVLRKELILTEAQQASLFHMLDAPSTSGSDSGLSAEDIAAIISAASNAKQPVEIPLYLDSAEVARATYPHIDRQLAYDQQDEYTRRVGKRP